MPKQVLRPKVCQARAGCGHTKWDQDYVLKDASDPFIPGTRVKRLRPLKLGPRNIGFLESEFEAMIDALAAERDKPRRIAS